MAMDMKQLRERLNKRVEHIAIELDIATSTVWNWEKGRHEPRIPISLVPKLLKAYECSLEEVINSAQESVKQYERQKKAGSRSIDCRK
jgi:transcriptional regulator with XRE-family HTH domain